MNIPFRPAALIAAAGILHSFVGESAAQPSRRWDTARQQLAQYIVEQGIQDRRVAAAIGATERHLFVPYSQRQNSYYDMALPIGNGQTISPPFVVAYMTEQLEPQPDDKVLEIGTGSGYQAAVLSPLVAEVYSIEIVEPLGRRAAQVLKRLDYKNVTTKVGDGFQGWAEHAPFDKIIVTCSPEKIPPPLVEQLKEGGRMVIPLGERYEQLLYLFTKVDGKLQKVPLEPTFFVPMTGKAEDLREVKDDNGRPQLENGSFEELVADEFPRAWYGVRLGSVDTEANAPDGKQCLTLKNTVAGRWAQALQAVALDGRRVQELTVSVSVRGRDVKVHPLAKDAAHVELNFFDNDRAPAGSRKLGPWEGTFAWDKKTERVTVPGRARLAVLSLSLSGGTGELSFDDVRITVVDESLTKDSQ